VPNLAWNIIKRTNASVVNHIKNQEKSNTRRTCMFKLDSSIFVDSNESSKKNKRTKQRKDKFDKQAPVAKGGFVAGQKTAYGFPQQEKAY